MKNYIEIMQDYSALGSWAIWESNREDGRFLKENDLIENIDFNKSRKKLQQSNIVVLAMNPGGTFDTEKAKNVARRVSNHERSWGNFHNCGKSRDYLLAEAFRETPVTGAYMTDIFPIVGSKSECVGKFVKSEENREVVKRLIREFDEEMSLLLPNCENIILLCLGRKTEKWAKKFLCNSLKTLGIKVKNTYTVHYLPHYSSVNRTVSNKVGENNYYPSIIKEKLQQYGI